MEPSPPDEKFLLEIGGWTVFRQARTWQEAGRVSQIEWAPPWLRGVVEEGERRYRAGLKVAGRVRTENLCSCRAARGEGTICAHSVAVALALIKPAPAPAASPRPSVPPLPGNGSVTPALTIPFSVQPESPARIHVVLAQNLAGAWRRGQVVVGVEVSGHHPRNPQARELLEALYPRLDAGLKGLPASDHQVFRGWAQALGTSRPGGIGHLDAARFLGFLTSLQGHPRVTLGRATAVEVTGDPLRPRLEVRSDGRGDPAGGRLRVVWPGAEALVMFGDQRSWVFLQDKDQRAKLSPLPVPDLPAAYRSLYQEEKALRPGELRAFLNVEGPTLGAFFELKVDEVLSNQIQVGDSGALAAKGSTPDSRATPPGAAPAFSLELDGSLESLVARLAVAYGDRRFPLTLRFSSQPRAFQDAGFSGRQRAVEEGALARLRESGFTPSPREDHYVLRGQDAVLRFTAAVLPELQQVWQVRLSSRYERLRGTVHPTIPKFEVRQTGENWFEVSFALVDASGRQFFSGPEIQRLLEQGKPSVRSADGTLLTIPLEALDDLQAVLRDCDPTQSQPGRYRIKPLHAPYLDATLRQAGAVGAGAGLPTWRERLGATDPGKSLPPLALPPALAEVLRPYQKQGVDWLRSLAAQDLGGILADEMGLGKTVQTLAFLASNKSAAADAEGATGPALVVCPTSLVENWRREAARFTPDLRTLVLNGPDRHLHLARMASADLVITSYALLRRDVERYDGLAFSTVVLDEAHHVKNPDSQVASAVCRLRASHRFVLTGTPVENSVRDLWSIMRFLLPGYLGTRSDFRDRYEQPILAGGAGSSTAHQRLQRRLAPFLLRRRKRDVVQDLPDKIEQVAYCELSPIQRSAYAQVLLESRKRADEAAQLGNQNRRRMLILTTLLRLRQVCCDLRLLGVAPAAVAGASAEPPGPVPGEAPEDSAIDDPESTPEESASSSGKLALLDEIFDQIISGNHRVLVFSQFASMLGLLAEHLGRRNVSHVLLDGRTKNRAETVDRFQTDPTISAFLISLKAGGVGLNLTGADVVIHFDPWWNPAVEDQATDRAHRIGQDKVVTVYRLVTRGTVEEKILRLHARKRDTAGKIIDGADSSDEVFLSRLSLQEIEGLLDESTP